MVIGYVIVIKFNSTVIISLLGKRIIKLVMQSSVICKILGQVFVGVPLFVGPHVCQGGCALPQCQPPIHLVELVCLLAAPTHSVCIASGVLLTKQFY